jgi:hypothetical protein
MRLLALLAAACAVALAAPLPAAANDPSGGAMAPADASTEVNTGGSVGPADEPAPAPAAPVTQTAPTPTAATPSSPAAPAPAPVSHAAGNAVEPEAGGDQPAGTDGSPQLEPLPPSSGQAQAQPKTGDSGSSLAMTGGALVTTLTLGLGFLSAGLAGTAIARRRRDAANQYS